MLADAMRFQKLRMSRHFVAMFAFIVTCITFCPRDAASTVRLSPLMANIYPHRRATQFFELGRLPAFASSHSMQHAPQVMPSGALASRLGTHNFPPISTHVTNGKQTIRMLFGGDASKSENKPKPASMFDAVKKASDLLARLKELQKKVASLDCSVIDGTDENKVKVVFGASGEPKSVEITEEAVLDGRLSLEKRIITAMKKAWKIANEKQREEYSKLYEEVGLPIPEFKKMLGGIDLEGMISLY